MSNNISFKDVFIKGAVIYNPVLIQLVGLCPVVAASTTLARAAMLSAVLCIELIVTCVISSAFLKKIPRGVRVPLYIIIGAAIICPLLWYVETQTLLNLSLGMKIFVPLIAVNSMTAVHCEQFSVKNSVKLSLYDAAAAGIGASFIFIIVGAVRELLGYSTVGGIAVNLPITFKGMALPFGCLILLGFLAAGLKAFVARVYPEDSENGEPEIKPVTQASEDYSQEATEVELFDEFWTESVEEEKPDIPVPEAPSAEKDEPKFSTAEEIDELLKSLGIDIDIKGDKQ
ncbi:MAG: hypothetical protein IJB45_09190 [Clostridia bacterium]|nr:hypothetical protein [Clostridia bacterium]